MDSTAGEWGGGGGDSEIMYANYTATAGWSNATVISDDNTLWNDGNSYYPSIAVDGSGKVHVVWSDNTVGEWGSDYEIMSATYTAEGWSNVTAISDIYGWNNGMSSHPNVDVDGNSNVHVVWHDDTVGEWGGGPFDLEIMYVTYTATGWSNAAVISDDNTLWNDDTSFYPSVAVDNSGNAHVVWFDDTDGEWESDQEIMYVKISVSKGQQFPLELLVLGLSGAQPGLMEQLTLILVGIGIAVLVVIIIVVVRKRQ